MRSMSTLAILLLTMFLVIDEPTPLQAATGVRLSLPGVTAWVADRPYRGESGFFTQGSWQQLSPDSLPDTLAGYPILESDTAILAFAPDGSAMTCWTRCAGRVVRRGEVTLDKASASIKFRLLVDRTRPSLSIEVCAPDMSRRHAVALSPDGMMEIQQPPGRSVAVSDNLPYVLVPSLVGTDLLFATQDLAPSKPSFLPSLNMLVGLTADHDCMLVAVWPKGEQRVRLERTATNGPATISLDTAGQSLYLALLDHPDIWHEEMLRSAYLERDTAIAWQRPFDARWIGRFHIESEEYDFPFFFLYEKQQLWGRCIRGWYYYPVWFDGSQTMVHFEKKFPPKGPLLIYYLDTYGNDKHTLSPINVMRRSLGDEETDELMDFAGATEQVLLEHRNAVCAMTSVIEEYFAGKSTAPPRAQVEQFADDVATFIRLIRQRDFDFEQFASEMQQFIRDQKKADPSLATALENIDKLLVEMRELVKEDMPKTPLDEVRGWTDSIKSAAAQGGPDNLPLVKTLTQQCRSVAGTQDDIARDLSVLTIRLMEEAARMGTASPESVRLAEQLITRSRAILRQPTWWEPCRRYSPKSNPGAQ